MAKKNIKSISKAIFSRLLVITHIIFLYLSFFLTNNDKNNLFSLLMIVGIVLICIEGVYTIIKRQGADWKWGSPLLFIYIVTAYLPCLIYSNVGDFSLVVEPAACTTSSLHSRAEKNETSTNPLSSKASQNANLEIFFLIVILCRWVLPKGKITLEDLSKLLLIYMSVIADILDMMKMVKHLRKANCNLKESFFYVSLSVLSVSILQLCLGLTAKRHSRTTKYDVNLINLQNKCKNEELVKQDNDDKLKKLEKETNCSKRRRILFSILYSVQKFYLNGMNKIVKTFEKEVWGILVSLCIKDVPFSILRTYALIAPPEDCILWDQSIFFTLKNYLTIVIQLNRCYVLSQHSDENQNSVDHQRSNSIVVRERINSLGTSTSSYSSPMSTNKTVLTNANNFVIEQMDSAIKLDSYEINKKLQQNKKPTGSLFSNKVDVDNQKRDSTSIFTINGDP